MGNQIGVKLIRSIVRSALFEKYAIHENDGQAHVYATNDKGKFPYEGREATQVPQDVDPVADYLWDYAQLADNKEIYEFPTTEFNLGLKIEKQRNPEFNILEVADKVISQLKGNPQFYSELREKYRFGTKPVQW